MIVDDDRAMRESLSLLMRSVGLNAMAFESAPQFLAQYQDQQPSCLVLDIRMPEMSGTELHRQLIERKIGIPVIFLTGHADVTVAVKSMLNGAFDFLEKPFHDQALLDCVHRAIKQDAERRLLEQEARARERMLARLTPREHSIARLISTGMTSREVADSLSLSTRTVEGYRARLFTKLEIDSLADLIRLIGVR